MEQIRTAHPTTTGEANDVVADSSRFFKDLQTLSDLELLCVGGGDGGVQWP
jgi:hypothetical protein